MIIEPERSGKTISDVCIAFGVSRENRYRMIIEPERSGKTISDVCIAFGVKVPPGGTIIVQFCPSRSARSMEPSFTSVSVIHIGNTHVGPVNVSGLNIYYYPVWVSAP